MRPKIEITSVFQEDGRFTNLASPYRFAHGTAIAAIYAVAARIEFATAGEPADIALRAAPAAEI